MKEIDFRNNIYIKTDYMGSFYGDQCKIVGWKDYANNKYYNLDEVKELYKTGKAGENVIQKDDGKLYMKTQHCSFISIGNIVCGILVNKDRNGENKNLFDYAEKQGWITQKPRPIKMTSFKKELEINEDGTYNIILSLFKEKFEDLFSYDYLEKICIGAIKKLKYNFSIVVGKEIELNKTYNCGEIIFDKEKLQIIIKNIDNKSIGKETKIIRSLDLELAINYTNKYNSYDIIQAVFELIRDTGQYHWLNEEESEKEKESNVFWYDKDDSYYEKEAQLTLEEVKSKYNK